MPELACLECGAPFTRKTYKQRRCRIHEPRGRASRSPTTRAQDAEYARNRKAILTGDPPCHWCARPGADTADHLVAVVNGGTNALSNLIPACGPCNFRRQANPNWTPPRGERA